MTDSATRAIVAVRERRFIAVRGPRWHSPRTILSRSPSISPVPSTLAPSAHSLFLRLQLSDFSTAHLQGFHPVLDIRHPAATRSPPPPGSQGRSRPFHSSLNLAFSRFGLNSSPARLRGFRSHVSMSHILCINFGGKAGGRSAVVGTSDDLGPWGALCY